MGPSETSNMQKIDKLIQGLFLDIFLDLLKIKNIQNKVFKIGKLS
jgi:hypothetical protein